MAQEKQVILLAVDDSPHSMYALEWTLDHFFAPFGSNHPFKLVPIHARPLLSSVLRLAGPGIISSKDVLQIMEVDLKETAARIAENVQDTCKKKSLNDVKVEVTEGDPRNVLCDAAEKHHATILVMGSHGYGVVKRAILGSVSDYCAHHADCSVMIVKKPKEKAPSSSLISAFHTLTRPET